MSKDPIELHFEESNQRISAQASDKSLTDSAAYFLKRSHKFKYSYNFTWLGRPIIQYPQDIVAYQEIVYNTRPDLIIETGIAHGGSLIFSASLLAMLDVMEGIDPKSSKRKVIGVDIDIREHNRQALDNHPLRYKLDLIEGSSIDDHVINTVHAKASSYQNIMVSLDSNHTHEHVLAELNAYAGLTSINNYCIVFDTLIEDLGSSASSDRPWDVGNNPKTALHQWLIKNSNFEIDHKVDNKLLFSVAPSGYLKRLS